MRASLSQGALVEMQGGAKGLFVNSRDVCAQRNRALVSLTAQSGRGDEEALVEGRWLLRTSCSSGIDTICFQSPGVRI